MKESVKNYLRNISKQWKRGRSQRKKEKEKEKERKKENKLEMKYSTGINYNYS